MTGDRSPCGDTHRWAPLSDGEVKELRAKTRDGRPPGAWLESASRCEVCEALEARISWFGQLHQVPVAPKQPGDPLAVHWPARP
jgi:hypothetical protein